MGFKRSPLSLEQRLWSHVDKSGDCWLWTSAVNRSGYGIIRVDGKNVYAHRLTLAWSLGRELEAGELACHHCDNPPCVRPDHLFAGTSWDNMADMVAKGRSARVPLSPERIATMMAGWERWRERRHLRTHCRHGHLYDAANTRTTADGRKCRTCDLDRYYRREKQMRRERTQRRRASAIAAVTAAAGPET